jgi:hypothetical protein
MSWQPAEHPARAKPFHWRVFRAGLRQFHQLRRSSLLTSVFQEHVGQFDTEWPGNGHLSTAAYDGWLAYSPRRAVRITRSSS